MIYVYIYIYIYIYIYPQTRVSSFPGLISVARVSYLYIRNPNPNFKCVHSNIYE